MDIVVNGAVNQNWQIVDQWSNVNAGGGCRLNWAISDVPIQSNQGHIFIIIQFQFVGALCKQIQIELIGGSFWVAQQGIHGGTLWGDHWWDLWAAHHGSIGGPSWHPLMSHSGPWNNAFELFRKSDNMWRLRSTLQIYTGWKASTTKGTTYSNSCCTT